MWNLVVPAVEPRDLRSRIYHQDVSSAYLVASPPAVHITNRSVPAGHLLRLTSIVDIDRLGALA